MTISLKPETEQLITERLRDGQFRSADEIVHAGLIALKEIEDHPLDEETLDALDKAEDAIERGEVHDWEDVREKVRMMFQSKIASRHGDTPHHTD